MSKLYPSIDPEGLVEYSVVYTDRSLNHMSQSFQGVMKNISTTLKQVYNAQAVAVVPGSGTFGMEAVARQFATDQQCLVIRNGWFSYRWSQILEMGNIPAATTVLKARPVDTVARLPTPHPLWTKCWQPLRLQRPQIVFAPTLKPHQGLSCPTSTCGPSATPCMRWVACSCWTASPQARIWVDMHKCAVDLLISAPQKGWSASPCCALVMFSSLALGRIEQTQSSSFACDLKKWLQIMQAYEQGGHAYHATMPSDSLARFNEVMKETQAYGFDKVRDEQQALGDRVRAMLTGKGFKSVAAAGFQAPGVVVSYTDDADIKSGRKFANHGLQIAAGVPLQCDEPADFQTFRIGLFGLEKLHNIERTVSTLEQALDEVMVN